MQIKINLIRVSMLLMFTLMLNISGCASADKVYDSASRYEATDEELKVLSEGKVRLVYDQGDFDSSYEYLRYVAAVYVSQGSQKIKEHAIGIMFSCIALGITLYYFSGNSTALKRWAWIIGLGGTLLVFAAVWGSALMADSFM